MGVLALSSLPKQEKQGELRRIEPSQPPKRGLKPGYKPLGLIKVVIPGYFRYSEVIPVLSNPAQDHRQNAVFSPQNLIKQWLFPG